MAIIIAKSQWASIQRPRVSKAGYRTRYEVQMILTRDQFMQIKADAAALDNGRCTSLHAPDNPDTYDGNPDYMNKEYYLEITRPVYSAEENKDNKETEAPGIVGPNAVTKFTDMIGNGSELAIKYYFKKTDYQGQKSVQARFSYDDPVVQVRTHVAYANSETDTFTAVAGASMPEGHTGESFDAAPAPAAPAATDEIDWT